MDVAVYEYQQPRAGSIWTHVGGEERDGEEIVPRAKKKGAFTPNKIQREKKAVKKVVKEFTGKVMEKI